MSEDNQGGQHRSFIIEFTRKDGQRVVKSFIRASDLSDYWEKHRQRKPHKA